MPAPNSNWLSSEGVITVGQDLTNVPVVLGGALTTFGAATRASSDRVNVRNYTAADGVTSDGAGLTAAGVVAAAAGKDVWVPAGTYAVFGNAPWLFKPGVAYYLDKRAVILCSDAGGAGNGNACHNNGVAGDYTIIGGLFRGQADTNPTAGIASLHIYGAGIVLFDSIRSEYNRSFGLAIDTCTKGTVRSCSVYRSIGDGIAVWRTPDAQVVNCDIEAATDDGISTQCVDADPTPRTVVLIQNNRMKECGGITSYGAKMVTVSGNILNRVMGIGIAAAISQSFQTGDTPHFGVKIIGNQIFDQMASLSVPRQGGQVYITVNVAPRQAGGGTAAPGDPTPTTGVVVPLLGASNTQGALYAQSTAGPQPGSYFVDISGNTLARTRPAVSAVSQWGGLASYWLGDNAGGAFYSGSVTEAQLNTPGITIAGTLRHSRISDNIIRTTGPGIVFLAGAANGDYDGLLISGNQISDFGLFGIQWASPGVTSHKMRVFGNTFDGDPQFKNANRGTGGTWAADSFPMGVLAQSLNGVSYELNHFRNVCSPINAANSLVHYFGNVYFGNISVFGSFSTANVGVGTVAVQGPGWQFVQEDADPRSATYGNILATPVSPLATTSTAVLRTGSTSTGEQVFTANNASGARFSNGTYGVMHYMDAVSYYIFATGAGTPLGAPGASRPFAVNLSTGAVTIANGLALSGNTGFYGTAPIAKPAITGSRGTESAATTSTRAALVALGLATDSTVA